MVLGLSKNYTVLDEVPCKYAIVLKILYKLVLITKKSSTILSKVPKTMLVFRFYYKCRVTLREVPWKYHAKFLDCKAIVPIVGKLLHLQSSRLD